MTARAESVTRWLWGTPPSAPLRDLARRLERGEPLDDARTIKAGRSREVFAVERLGVLVKRFEVRGLDGWRARWLPSRARREYRIMEELVRLGVPTTRPLACGETRAGARVTGAWFVAEYLAGARTLGDVLAACDDDADRAAWARRAVEAVARLHDHPYHHRDLHAGNLLVDEYGELHIVDLHSVWRVRRLGPRRRAASLAELLFSLREWIDLRDLGVFVAHYAAARGERVEDVLRRVRPALDAFERDYVRGRTARCVRDSSLFEPGDVPAAVGRRGRLFRRRDLAEDALVEAVADFERVVRDGDGLLGDARRAQVARVGRDGAVVAKSFRERGLVAALRAWLGAGRGRSAWTAGRRLEVVGIPTPRTLALCEWRDGSALLLTEHVDGVTLRDRLSSPIDDVAERARLARAVGWLVGRLWQQGLRHPDMSTKNLLVVTSGDELPGGRDRATCPAPGTPLVHVIDLDNLETTARHDRRALARMLGQLGDVPDWVTRSDRRRVVREVERVAARGVPPDVQADAQARTAARRERRAARR